MDGRDRPGSRSIFTHLIPPTSGQPHLTEREREIRRIRQSWLLGDLFGPTVIADAALDPVSSGRALEGARRAGRGDLAGAIRCYEDALHSDGDCYEAWVGLAVVFRDMADPLRARRCLDVAHRLRLAAPPRPLRNDLTAPARRSNYLRLTSASRLC